MPKVIDYPTASFRKSLELAGAVSELGGSSSIEMCAEKLNKKVSGGFHEVIHSAVKYGFLTHKKGEVSVTPFYKDIKLAYSPEDETKLLQKAFLSIPLFQKVYDRFKGQKLPVSIFEKLLIKEFNVNERIASRVMAYFLDGAKKVSLLTADNMVASSVEVYSKPTDADSETQFGKVESEATSSEKQTPILPLDSYSVKISGPGINSTIAITEQDDLEIVNIMLNKIRKKLETEKTDS